MARLVFGSLEARTVAAETRQLSAEAERQAQQHKRLREEGLTIWYVTTTQTVTRTYSVEAKSGEHACQMVTGGLGVTVEDVNEGPETVEAWAESVEALDDWYEDEGAESPPLLG